MAPRGFWRIGKDIGKGLAAMSLLVVLAGCASMGDAPSGDRLKRIEASPNFRDGEFVNTLPTNLVEPGTNWELTWEFLFGDQIRTPPGEIPIISWAGEDLSAPASTALRAAWLGHASVMVEMDGMRILIDPVFSERASPFGWVGPVRFHPTPIELESLPPIDLVLISHNHYDHLDMETVKFLAGRESRFLVGLGIGAHLEYWGVPLDQIEELDWGEETNLGPIRIVSNPARHYANRGVFDTNENLWTSWSILGAHSRVYYSGDTGYSPHFADIGQKYGPFDLTIIKIGAYHLHWQEIHMTPEKAIDAHIALKGRRMLPVHWGTFNMAHHDWDEPIRRAVADAQAKGVEMVSPKVGEWVTAGSSFKSDPWWEGVQ